MSALLPPGVHAQFPPDEQLTPLFRQYCEIKASQPDSLLLYRLGDFYELFGQDAVDAAGTLGLTLTSRACGKDYKVAMAGVPHHSSTRYIKRLLDAGYSIAMCEQTEDPAQAKGLVERAVTRVITAGTLVEEEFLADDRGNYLAAAARRGNSWGVAVLESSGGAVDVYELDGGGARSGGPTDHVLDLIMRQRPAEVILPAELHSGSALTQRLRLGSGPAWRRYESLPAEREVERYLRSYLELPTLAPLGLEGREAGQAALFALVRYLRETFKAGKLRLRPRLVPLEGTLYLDERAVASLDLLPSDAGPGLFGVLNRCVTSAGRRLLRRRLTEPFAEAAPIASRHDSLALLLSEPELAAEAEQELSGVQDVERIAQRVCLGRRHPREVAALGMSLAPLGRLRGLLAGAGDALLVELAGRIADFEPLARRIGALLADEPPTKLADGGAIRDGADSAVDELRALVAGGGEWFAEYEAQQRERTGIRTLKVKRTDAFGWFIEVGRGSSELVPAEYQRRQTLVSAERYVTAELTERDIASRSAGTRLLARERELFEALCASVAEQAAALADAAAAAAELDVLRSFAAVAAEGAWVRPELAGHKIGQDSVPVQAAPAHAIQLTGARHPIVEAAVGSRYYTPNDCWLDSDAQQVMVLTGPNMGGKSTYLRMVAVQCVMAQLGSYVPAERARLPLLRRIYTRVGAEDRLARGQSTFMVEMVETAEILNTCGPGSLVILDEVGRGTSTYDGISIAKAVLEHLHEHPARPLVLFATHFFELTDLDASLARAENFHVQVARGEDDGFVFLYRVGPGAASDSFGIEVAALAGLPDGVVARARQILAELEDTRALARERARRAIQLGLF